MASGLSETAKLVSSLELKDNFTPTANKAIKSLGKLESTGFRVGQQIGKGFNNAAHNLKRIAQVGVVALTGAIALGVKSLGDLARTQNQTAAVIASTGGKAKVTTVQVRAYAESLESLSTVDDKVIQDGENMLLTFTNIGSDVFPQATKAALDMSLAMAGGNVEQVDLKASAIQLGKALNDPIKGITALQKVGVTFTKKQKDRIAGFVKEGKIVEAQKVILAELNKEFGKSSEAAGKGPEAVMRRLSDAGEDLSQILARGTLPVLERFGKFLTAKLTDPAFMAQVDEFGTQLGIAGGKFLDFVEKVDFKAIGNALKIGADAAGAIIGAFLKAPTWLQTAIVTGWGLNKLTGGAVQGIFGELASGLIKGVLGMNAGVVNINAGTVVGGGGAASAAGAASTALTGLQKVFLVGEAIGLALLVNEIRTGIESDTTKVAAAVKASSDAQIAHNPSKAELTQSLAGVEAGIRKLESDPIGTALIAGPALTELKGIRANILKALNDKTPSGRDSTTQAETTKGNVFGTKGLVQSITDKQEATTTSVESMKGKIAGELADNKTAIDGAASASTSAGNTAANAARVAGYGVQAAIRSSQPIITTNTDVRVYVTAAGVTKSVTEQSRYGKGNGSAGGGGDSGVSSSDL